MDSRGKILWYHQAREEPSRHFLQRCGLAAEAKDLQGDIQLMPESSFHLLANVVVGPRFHEVRDDLPNR